MITKQQTNTINYIVMFINDFAARFNMDAKSAYHFLSEYGGIAFLLEHYEIEHTLSLDDAIDDLERICVSNGGILS
ncbi:hypothetical protein FACS189492_0400 [Clostridia bacterium]|nr:hypothetical protein FACS189492_0400 [Clostridia bacterium]